MQVFKPIGAIDYAGIILFFALMAGVGLYFFFRTKRSEDFFVGGRVIPGWISGLSHYMTSFSAMAFVGSASVAYRHGGWILFLQLPLCFVLPNLLSAPIAARWQRTGLTTVPEYLNTRFGASTRYLFALVGIPSRILDNGNRIYTTAVFVGTALGIGKAMGLWGSSFIILAYTFMGGLWAVVVTDVIQFFLKTLATILVVIIGMKAIGGLGTFVQNSAPGYWSLSPDNEFTVWYAVAISIVTFINVNGYWSIIQRYTSTPTAWEAKKVSLISAFASLLFLPLIYTPPMLATQLIPGSINALVDSGMPLKLAAERSYALLCMKVLPPGLIGLVVVAIFAATMGALSAEYNIISAVVTKDLYQGMIRRGKEIADGTLLWIGRFTTLVVVVLCTLAGANIDKMGGAFQFVFALLGLTSGPTYLPPLLGLFFKRTPAWGANLAFCLGLTAGLVTKFGFSLPLIGVVLINVSVTVATFLLAGVLNPVQGEQKSKVDDLFRRLSPTHSASESTTLRMGTSEKRVNPQLDRVIAVGCLVYAGFLYVAAVVTRAGGGLVPNLMCALGLTGVAVVLLVKPKPD